MKQQPTQFGQAVMQLAQARQQLGNLTVEHRQTVRQLEGSRQHVADLQDQVIKMAAENDDLKALMKDYMEFSKYATPLLKRGRLEWEAESEALAQRAQALLAEKEQ